MVDNDERPFTPVDGVLFTAISLIWGASFLLIAIGLEDLTPGMVALVRVGAGAATLLLMRFIVPDGNRSIDRADLPRVIALSFVWVAVPFTLFPLAQEHINSALAGLLNGGTPIFVAVIGTIVTGRRPKGLVLFGLGLGFVGVVALSLPSIGQGASEARGVAMVVAATVCYGVAFNLAGPLQQRYGAVPLMSTVLGLATVWLLPVGFRDLAGNQWAPDTLGAVLVLGVVGTGLAYWIMSSLVGRIGSVRGSFITYLIPVVALLLGVVFRGDTIAGLALFGAALTTLGAVLASGRFGSASVDPRPGPSASTVGSSPTVD